MIPLSFFKPKLLTRLLSSSRVISIQGETNVMKCFCDATVFIFKESKKQKRDFSAHSSQHHCIKT